MLKGLLGFHASRQQHFITCSCYHRQPFLASMRRRDLFLTHPEGCHSMIYPEDANGIVLRRIAAQGKDLTKARDIDFTVIFAQGSSAEQFAEHFRELGYAVSV